MAFDLASFIAAINKASAARGGSPSSPSTTRSQTPTPSSTSGGGYGGSSIVDYLRSTGGASDFNSRAALAAKQGISNYTGTAEQNTTLLNNLRAGSTAKPKTVTVATSTMAQKDFAQKQQDVENIQNGIDAQAQTRQAQENPPTTLEEIKKLVTKPIAPTNTQTSIVDYLKSSGQPSDLNSRAALAVKLGISPSTQDYLAKAANNANAVENVAMLKALQGQTPGTQAGQTQGTQGTSSATTATNEPTPTPKTYEDLLGDQLNKIDDAYNSYKKSIDQLRRGTFPLSREEKALVDSTQSTYDRLKEEQKTANRSYEALIKQAGYRTGTNLTDPTQFIALNKQAVDQGLSKIATIEQTAINTIAKLKEGFMEKDYKMVNDQYDRLYANMKDRTNVVMKLHDDAVAAEKDLRDYNLNVQKFTYQQQQDARQFNLSSKLAAAQIANINSEISARDLSGIGGTGDASQLIAYAQQYASTGQIPTGLPKGSFGMVAQTAKELPKQSGQIVDATTGIQSSKLSGPQLEANASLYDLSNKITQAEKLYSGLATGAFGGTFGNIFPSQQRQAYFTLRGEIVDLLARARTGAAINASEEQMYLSKVPGSLNQFLGFGTSGENKLKGLQSSIEGKLDANLRAAGASMYGFSKVSIGGKQYTVGDVVQNSQGQTGRINADGSITLIQ